MDSYIIKVKWFFFHQHDTLKIINQYSKKVRFFELFNNLRMFPKLELSDVDFKRCTQFWLKNIMLVNIIQKEEFNFEKKNLLNKNQKNQLFLKFNFIILILKIS